MKSQIESRFSARVVNKCIIIATLVLTVGVSIAIAKSTDINLKLDSIGLAITIVDK